MIECVKGADAIRAASLDCIPTFWGGRIQSDERHENFNVSSIDTGKATFRVRQRLS